MAFLSLTRGNTHVLNQNDFNEGYGVEDYFSQGKVSLIPSIIKSASTPNF